MQRRYRWPLWVGQLGAIIALVGAGACLLSPAPVLQALAYVGIFVWLLMFALDC